METLIAFTKQLMVGGHPNIDAQYGPWESIQAYKTWMEDNLADISKGTTIGIIEGGVIKEYWNPSSVDTFITKSPEDFLTESDINGLATEEYVNTKIQEINLGNDLASKAYVENKISEIEIPGEAEITGWGFTKNTGSYSKPEGGIPETDLSKEVRGKLNNVSLSGDYIERSEFSSLENTVQLVDDQVSSIHELLGNLSRDGGLKELVSGEISPVVVIKDKVISNYSYNQLGYWEDAPGYNSYIFDATGNGTSISVEVTVDRKVNSYSWVYISDDYELIPTSLDKTLWQSLCVAGGKSAAPGLYSFDHTFPLYNESKYIILSGTDETPATIIKGDSLVSDVEKLKENVSITSWQQSEINRIVEKIKTLSSHNISIVGFSTDHEFVNGSRQNKRTNYPSILRGLKSLEKLSGNINMSCICLGGNLSSRSSNTKSKILDNIIAVKSALSNASCPVIEIAGTNEAWQGLQGTSKENLMTGRDLFNFTIKDYVLKKSIIPLNIESTCCYFDDDLAKIRYVFLDTESNQKLNPDDETEVLAQMYGILDLALNDEKVNPSINSSIESYYSVVIFGHRGLDTDGVWERNIWSDNSPNKGISSYINDGVKIIAYIHGHLQIDRQEVKDGVNVICTASEGGSVSSSGYDGLNITRGKTRNTSKENAFDIFVFDTDEEKIYTYRFGYGNDRVFDYSDGNSGIMFSPISGTVTKDGGIEGLVVKVEFHNIEYSVTLDSSGAFEFPYICPNSSILLKVYDSGEQLYSESISVEFSPIVKQIELT